MPDYIYLLENRLSADQQNALRQLREAAREAGTILFLTGDAVRELTRGVAVRDLEVVGRRFEHVGRNIDRLRLSAQILGPMCSPAGVLFSLRVGSELPLPEPACHSARGGVSYPG